MTTTFIRSPAGLVLLLALTLTTTDAYRPKDFPCRANFQCDGKVNLYCNSTRLCDLKGDIGQACVSHDGCISGRCSGGVCQVQKPSNETSSTCEFNEDCSEGYCNSTTALCIPWKERKELCDKDFECRSGRCTNNPRVCEFVIYEPNICGKNEDCFGERCKKDRGLNQCYDRKPNYYFCNDNSDCLSLRCEATNCTEPLWSGEPCDEPSDCYSLFCNKEKGCVDSPDEADIEEIEQEIPQEGISGTETAVSVHGGGGTFDVTGSNNGGELDVNGSSGMSFLVHSVGGVVLVAASYVVLLLSV